MIVLAGAPAEKHLTRCGPYAQPADGQPVSVSSTHPIHNVVSTGMIVMTAKGSVRACIWVSGLVQGVAYRAFTQRSASHHGLRGGVRNLDDGRVSVEVEGERQAIESLIASLRNGPPMAQVQDVQVRWETPTNQYGDFRIWY
jgi:acylphosphatase